MHYKKKEFSLNLSRQKPSLFVNSNNIINNKDNETNSAILPPKRPNELQKRKTLNFNNINNETNNSTSSSPKSQSKSCKRRSSFLNNLNNFAFGADLLRKNKNPSKESLLDIMRKSVLDLHRKESGVHEKNESFYKEELLKNLMSGKLLSSELNELTKVLLQKPYNKRTRNDINILKYCMENVKFFQEIKRDAETILEKCCYIMKYKHYKKNEIVFQEGTIGKIFYIILEGKVCVCKISEKTFENNENFEKQVDKHEKEFFWLDEKTGRTHLFYELKVLTAGNSFGQLALIENRARSATIVCKEDCHFAIIEKEYFDEILKEVERNNLAEEIKYFSQQPFLKPLSLNVIKTLYLNADLCDYRKFQNVYSEQDKPEFFYIIKSGQFEITKNKSLNTNNREKPHEFFVSHHFNSKEVHESEVLILSPGNFFGHEEIYLEIPRKYNVRCFSAEGTLFQIYKLDFMKMIFSFEKNQSFFALQSKEMNNYLNKRIEMLDQNLDKAFMQTISNSQRQISFEDKRNYELDSEELSLFFSDEILRNKDKITRKIYKKNIQCNPLEAIPKLFESSMNENQTLLKKGIISKKKLQPRKKAQIEKIPPKQKNSLNKPANAQKTQEPLYLARPTTDFFFQRHFSLGQSQNYRFISNENFAMRAAKSFSKSRQKDKDKSYTRDNDKSDLIVYSSKNLGTTFSQKLEKNDDPKSLTGAQSKFTNFLKKRFEKSDYKQKFDEPYGLKNSMLPLKYMTKNIIQENERKDLGLKSKKVNLDYITKRKF